MQVLSDRNCIPETWTEIDYSHPWGLESPNYSAFEYYYIDQDKYSAYEDVSVSCFKRQITAGMR